MSKLVVFNIGEGNFEQGFPVTLLVGEEGKLPYKDHQDKLPPAPELPELYRQWQQKYYGLEAMRRVIKVPPAQITNVSSEDCEKAAEALEACVKEWFERSSLVNLRSHVLEEVGKIESARVIFQTQDELLRKLPWHLWDLFIKYRPNAEFSISARYAPDTPALKRPIKILAILGGNEGIDVTEDLKLLKELPATKVTLLEKPKREELNNHLWDRPWDILFFAGHSSSQEGGKRGVIQLNDTDSLSLSQLRYALKKAIANNLKLAIFNSCDGLGLANELADLQIPQAIVMREPVPDRVAQKFLRYFLEYFSKGESFYLAVRQAREKLQGMEDEFPGASWLPVIYQNPAQKPLIWPRSPITQLRTKIRRLWRSNKIAVLAGGAIMIAVAIGFPIIPVFIINPKTPNIDTKSLPIATRISSGEKLLISKNTNPDKEKGIRAVSNKNFEDAIKHFRNSLQKNKNDPESLIYLNNAIAEQNADLNTGEKLKIAVNVPINEESNVAEEVLRGVAQAQSEVNCTLEEISRAIDNPQSQLNCSGGIDKKLLQVSIANDEDKSDIAEQIADTLSKDRDILGVLGRYSSDTTLPVISLYEKQGLVLLSPTSTSVSLSNISKYFFRTAPSDAVAARDLFDYMRTALGSSVEVAVAYHPGSDYSESLKEEFRKLLPSKQFVAECNLSRPDFSSGECVNRAKQKQAKVLLLIPSTKGSLDKALRVVNSNKGELKLLAGDVMYNPRTLIDSGEAAAKSELVVAVPWHSPNSEFAQKANMLWEGGVNWRTAMGYDATQAMVEGLRRINGSPERQRLKQVMSRPDFSAIGATGKVEFEPSGDRKLSTNIGVLVQVQPNPKGDFPYRFALLE
jgi:branched-chain amino acid transport system substrate-binding protein